MKEVLDHLCLELERECMKMDGANDEHAYTIACLDTEAERRFLLDHARAARGEDERHRATCRALYTAYLVHLAARHAWKAEPPALLQGEAESTAAAVYEAMTGKKPEGKEYAGNFLPWLNEAAPAEATGSTSTPRG